MTDVSVAEEGVIAFDYSAEAELSHRKSEFTATTNWLQAFCPRC